MPTPAKTIDDMPVLAWADLHGVPIPWEQLPADVVDRWKHSRYGVICLMDYGYEDTREYWFVLCDRDWNTVASDFSYSVEGAKEALAKEIGTEALDWIEA